MRYKYYKVKKGDKLTKIAERHEMSLAKILEINKMTIKKAAFIKIGQKLKIGVYKAQSKTSA